MTRAELAEAIPPVYTEFLGKQIIEYLDKQKERNQPCNRF